MLIFKITYLQYQSKHILQYTFHVSNQLYIIIIYMSQIINLQVGKCGNQISQDFWSTLSKEHSIDQSGIYNGIFNSQIQKINVYYKHLKGNQYVPRTILIDSQSKILDDIRNTSIGQLLSQNNFVSGKYSTENNWAKGYLTQGAKLIEHILDSVRRQIQNCDSLQGFQMTHSVGGGTGSGLGSLIMSKIRESYSNRIIKQFSILPSFEVSGNYVQLYNSMLCFHQLSQTSDYSILFDNKSLFNICIKNLKISNPTYVDLNYLTSTLMAGITSTLRFPSKINKNLRKLGINLVPYKRLNFLMAGFGPLLRRDYKLIRQRNTSQLVSQIFDSKNLTCGADLRHGRFLTSSTIFRGKISQKQIYDHLFRSHGKLFCYFVQWIPNNLNFQICEKSSNNIQRSAVMICNSTSIQQMFKRMSVQFDRMYKKRIFVNRFTSEGMDQMQFMEAKENMKDLLYEYNKYETSLAEEYGEFEQQG